MASPKTQSSTFASTYDALNVDLTDPATGIDKTETVVRMLVLTALQNFRLLNGRAPTRVFIPRALEVVLEVDRGRNLGRPTATHGKIRTCQRIFGCIPTWDAKEFRCE